MRWLKLLVELSMHKKIALSDDLYKISGYALSSQEGPLGDKVMNIRRGLGSWIRNRKEVLMPKWLRGVARLIMKGDQKVLLKL